MLQCQISFLFHLLIKELQELHSALEEAKADIVGLWALKFLIDKVSIVFFFLNAYVSVNYVTIHGIYILVAYSAILYEYMWCGWCHLVHCFYFYFLRGSRIFSQRAY